MVDHKKNIKICLASSAGGHLTQLLKLDECWSGHQIFFITTSNIVSDKLSNIAKVYVTGECNRNHPVLLLKALIRCTKAVWKEKPDVVISTGAATGCIACFLGKCLGAKVIWLDSITNVDHLSMSGRLTRHIANLFLVQWPKLAQKYKNVEYMGAVI